MTNPLCPCGSNQPQEQCCVAIIKGEKPAPSAERLMRSRYSAYALGYPEYVAATYASEKQAANPVTEIRDWMSQTKWLKLEVIDTDETDNQQRFVEFKAYYLHQQDLCVMHERSRFIMESAQWRYIDGDIIEHTVVKKLSRNDSCPCLSGKKFKRCCGQ